MALKSYLVFPLVYKYFERVGNDISSWESKVLSNQKFSSTTTTCTNKFAPNLIYNNARIKVKFNGENLMGIFQSKIKFTIMDK